MKKSQVSSLRSQVENSFVFRGKSKFVCKSKCNDSGLGTWDLGLPKGFTLLELIITITVLSVMVLTALPLAQNVIRRQKEQELREALREMRMAIDQFKRDTIGACQPGQRTGQNQIGAGTTVADPRTRVQIDDCEIFDASNLDRYPPTLEILVEGVKVIPRGANIKTNTPFSDDTTVFSDAPKDLKKVYLREIPVDPITGKKDWKIRSSYQTKDDGEWDSINVFDVRSASDEEAMNGEKYSDW
jgi:general secretion pathway protein G